MKLSAQQLAQFERDGFLVFPGLFTPAEIAVLRAETARLAAIEADTVIRERTGGVRSIFRVHEEDGATRAPAFRALVRSPRVLEPTMQVLFGPVYVYHTKINTKPAIEGTVWMWHQDYGSWQRDGCPRPHMATFAVMMTDSVEMNGALYVIPGSHKRGRIEPYYDESTSYKFWAVPKAQMISILRESEKPVPIVGPAGTAALFHCNALQFGPNTRPDWVVSRNTAPLTIEEDEALLSA